VSIPIRIMRSLIVATGPAFPLSRHPPMKLLNRPEHLLPVHLRVPGRRSVRVPLSHELIRTVRPLALGPLRVRDDAREIGEQQIEPLRPQGSGDLLVGLPFGQLAGADPVEQFPDRAAQVGC
jgi:hypothetical protein